MRFRRSSGRRRLPSSSKVQFLRIKSFPQHFVRRCESSSSHVEVRSAKLPKKNRHDVRDVELRLGVEGVGVQ